MTAEHCGSQGPFATAYTTRLPVLVSLCHGCLTVSPASAILELTLSAWRAMDLYDPYVTQLSQSAPGRLPNPANLHSFLDQIVHTSTKRRSSMSNPWLQWSHGGEGPDFLA